MFENLKQLGQLKSMHDQMQREQFSVEHAGVTVVVTGALNIESITIADDIPRQELGSRVMNAVNEALKKAQRSMAQHLMGMSK